jgi:hypothetical protein
MLGLQAWITTCSQFLHFKCCLYLPRAIVFISLRSVPLLSCQLKPLSTSLHLYETSISNEQLSTHTHTHTHTPLHSAFYHKIFSHFISLLHWPDRNTRDNLDFSVSLFSDPIHWHPHFLTCHTYFSCAFFLGLHLTLGQDTQFLAGSICESPDLIPFLSP